MTLIKRNPVNTIDNLFDTFFRDEPIQWMNRNRNSTPLVNIHENDEAYHLEVSAPGFEKGDFTLELNHNVLVIKGEHKHEENKSAKNYSLREFNHASFERKFNLPEGKVNEHEVQANYSNGILTIELPKREEHKPAPSRLIEIK